MPMKRDASLIPLSHDHHHALVRVFEIRQAIRKGEPLDAQRKLARDAMREELAAHFAAEEEHLVPTLLALAVVEEEVVDELVAEHRELERLIAAEDDASLAAFADLLERHVRNEERKIFPAYQEKVPTEQRERVGAGIALTLGRRRDPSR